MFLNKISHVTKCFKNSCYLHGNKLLNLMEIKSPRQNEPRTLSVPCILPSRTSILISEKAVFERRAK